MKTEVKSASMDLTLIIPTYQRPQYAKRQIAFWSGRAAFVIVVDGSEEALVFREQPSQNITYIHTPGTFAHRVGIAARLITTKYVALLPDDEFYIPDALKSCVNFLEKNRDYSTCKGVSLAFRRNKRNGECEAISNNDNLRGYEVDCETPSERLCKHFNNYTIASIYAVQPAEVFKTIVNIFNKNRIYSTSADFEIQISSVSAWMGKIKVLNELMWFRSMENANITNKGTTPLQYWATEPDYAAERDTFVSDFKSVVNKHLVDECPGQILKQCLEKIGVKLRKRSRNNRWKFLFERLIFALWIRLPNNTIKPWVRKLLGRDKLLIEFCKELDNEGIKICFSEVEEIRDLIKQTVSHPQAG